MAALARSAPRLRSLCLALALAGLASILAHGLFPSGERPPPPAVADLARTATGGLALLPPGAQGVVSASVGAEMPAYRLAARGDTVRARNPSQRIRGEFGPAGAAIASGPLRLSVGPAVIAGVSAGTASRVIAGNRVTYSRGPVREWFANGPAGIEQGFTITRALAARRMVISQPFSGAAGAALSGDGRSIKFHGPAPSTLAYTDVSASDATGRQLPVRLSLRGGAIVMGVDVAGARYPITVDPLVQQGEKLTATPSEENKGGAFGVSVALSANGRTAVVGAFGVIIKGVEAGAAWVFTRAGSAWQQQGPRLTAQDETGAGLFGTSVALSADGNTALVGGPADGEHGAAWIFTRSGSAWSQQGGKLTAAVGEATGATGIGTGVAISADGSTALLGGPGDESETGAVWAFTRSGSTWVQQGSKILGKEESGFGQFGGSVALAGDGNTAIVGGLADAGNAGAAWALTRSGATWSQEGKKLTGGGEIGAGEMGVSVALSADGSTALVGGPHDNSFAGAAWVFARSGSAWSLQGGKLTAGAEEINPGQFGQSAALSSDGSTALIGAYFDNENVGAAWEFARRGATWEALGGKKTGGGEVGKAEYGIGVALSADGDTGLVGGEGDNGVGAVWPYADPPPSATTGVATGIGQTTATLTGSAGAGASCTARFEYGTSASYGAATPPVAIPNSSGIVSNTPLSAAVGGLPPSTTYHYRLVMENSAGASYGADQVLQTAAPPPVPPRLSALRQTHRTWREGRKAASLTARRPPLGTTFLFSIDQPASVTLTFTQPAAGRRSGRRCVAPTSRNRHARSCTRSITRGGLSFAAHSGADRISFQGSLSRSRRLPPGRYTVLVSAVNSAGLRSPAAALSFTIAR